MKALFSVAAVLLGVWALVSAFPNAEAQSVARPARATSTAAWMSGQGVAFSPSGMTVDGGLSATTLRVGQESVQDLYVDGGTYLNNLEVSGAANFRQRPAGVFVLASLTKAASLTVGIGCSSLGTVSVPGMEPNVNACTVASLPTSALNLGVTYDCYVTASGVVTVRACGLVALVAAPAGIYRLVLSGPAN